MKSMFHGLPGVVSSMKRPNSGWKIGAVLPSLCRYDLATSHQHLLTIKRDDALLLAALVQVGHATALGEQLLVIGEGLENVGLTQREPDLMVVVVVAYHQILDLYAMLDQRRFPDSACRRLPYLIAPQQSIALFVLCSSPSG